MKPFSIGSAVEVRDDASFFFIGGPCVIESPEHIDFLCGRIKDICARLEIPYVFKASFDKANRSSIKSFRGPGVKEGARLLRELRQKHGVPVLSDMHEPDQAEILGEAVDVIQIPAFLCRQTDLLIAAAKTGCVINVKKGQFLSPWDMKNVVEKIRSSGNEKILLTERGASFGYNNLVVDFRSLDVMRNLGCGVIFDATHSVQLPGGEGTRSGGQREFIEPLARAAAAIGVHGIFMEVHDRPDEALSDGPNACTLGALPAILNTLVQIDRIAKNNFKS
jgi:2-dehydro-3-deoxyphosphooctonate aldolase (KDO 8-P synthase)